MYKSIIVPLDGSELSEKALPYALKLASALDTDLTLLIVIENPDFPGGPFQKEHVRKASEYLAKRQEWLDSDREFLKYSKQIALTVLVGDPTEEISRFVEGKEESLVVMTTHGRSGLSRLLLGSVAAKVLHRVKNPVMLVRSYGKASTENLEGATEAQAEPYATTFLREGAKLLVPLDQTENSEAAVNPAIELAKQLKASLYLLKVCTPAENTIYPDQVVMAFYPEDLQKKEGQARATARVYLGQVAQLANTEGIETVIQAVTGNNPAEEIIRYANLVEPDFIIMSTHARGELGRLLYGSVANQVLQMAHLPVLMVPTAKAELAPVTGPAEKEKQVNSQV
ncbi:MAG: universal stress protein [Chloroflexi bacterium]|nr:universal stress protein [Chloroflexota bacterium]OJW01880.1 MAG: hypothetical protein BGO39_28445 [Chloroflexi bacterium 54-19]